MKDLHVRYDGRSYHGIGGWWVRIGETRSARQSCRRQGLEKAPHQGEGPRVQARDVVARPMEALPCIGQGAVQEPPALRTAKLALEEDVPSRRDCRQGSPPGLGLRGGEERDRGRGQAAQEEGQAIRMRRRQALPAPRAGAGEEGGRPGLDRAQALHGGGRLVGGAGGRTPNWSGREGQFSGGGEMIRSPRPVQSRQKTQGRSMPRRRKPSARAKAPWASMPRPGDSSSLSVKTTMQSWGPFMRWRARASSSSWRQAAELSFAPGERGWRS
jgi:hypothetical protein